MKVPFMKKVFITDEINQKTQHDITPAGSRIAKGLQVHDPAEWRIKKINNRKDKIPGIMYVTSHRWAKVKAKRLKNLPAGRQGKGDKEALWQQVLKFAD